MSHLVFCLEEPSAKAMLEKLLPRILPEGVSVGYIVFEGKQDLHKQLGKRLRGWQRPDTRFIVIRDQDSSDCIITKAELANICAEAGRADTMVRIACCELESWYLGDLQAVELGLKLKGLAKHQGSNKFRHPDALVNAAEELKKLTKGKYQKLSGSRAIAPHLSLSDNKSTSFNVLIRGIERVCKEMGA